MLSEGLLAEFEKAVLADSPWEAVRVIFASPAFDGLCDRLRAQWSWLPEDDVNQAVAQAFESLYEALRSGRSIEDPVLWLAGTARHKAVDLMRAREREELQGGLSGANSGHHSSVLLEDDERRFKLVQLARGLVPRLGSTNVQAVMDFYLDAVEHGVSSVSYNEIAGALGVDKDNVKTWAYRGFSRLTRLAQEEGLAEANFELLPKDLQILHDIEFEDEK